MPHTSRRVAPMRSVHKSQSGQSKVNSKPVNVTAMDTPQSNGEENPSTSKQITSQKGCSPIAIVRSETSLSTSPPLESSVGNSQTKELESSSSTCCWQALSKKSSTTKITNALALESYDDNENDIECPVLKPMRYVDVARAGMDASMYREQALKLSMQQPKKDFNIGLDEFPLLKPQKSFASSSSVNRGDTDEREEDTVAEANDDDNTEADGETEADAEVEAEIEAETDSSSLNSESFSDVTVETVESVYSESPDFIIEEIEVNNLNKKLLPKTNNRQHQCCESTSGICCEADMLSLFGSYCTEESLSSESEQETKSFSIDDDGGGDAVCTPQTCKTSTTTTSDKDLCSNFSNEWVDETIKHLAQHCNVSIPSFNFLQPDVDFPRFERQFDDVNYARLEDRAMFAFRLAENRDFFKYGNNYNCGNYM